MRTELCAEQLVTFVWAFLLGYCANSIQKQHDWANKEDNTDLIPPGRNLLHRNILDTPRRPFLAMRALFMGLI